MFFLIEKWLIIFHLRKSAFSIHTHLQTWFLLLDNKLRSLRMLPKWAYPTELASSYKMKGSLMLLTSLSGRILSGMLLRQTAEALQGFLIPPTWQI
jgi:hypothetical protein